MPYPAQIEPARALETARQIIESEGAAGLTLAKLASVLNVSAPSLYRHFASKNDLLRAVNLETQRRLTEVMLEAANTATSARDRALVMAAAYRDFAHANPVSYMQAFSQQEGVEPDAAAQEALAIPLQQIMAELVSEADSLIALRGLWALIHGFTSLELSGRFRRGGDLGAVFERSLAAYIDGWSR